MKIKQLKLNGVAFYPKVGVDSIVDAAGTKSAVDTVVTENSINLITSGAVYNSVPTKTSDLTNDSNFVNQSQLSGKQDLLISGTNIKTVNGNSLLSSGNIDVVTDLDDHLNNKSENAIQNKPVAEAIEAIDGRVGALEDAIGDGGSIDERIEETVSAAKSEIKGNATLACDTLGKAEALITAEVSARVNAVSTEVTRAQAAETAILNLYQSLSQSAIEVVDTLPPTGNANNIYRLVGTTSYSDYMYNTDDLNTPILMATYNNAIENEPTPGSNNLVKSGGVAAAIVFDISAYHATGSTLATYADLAAALGYDGANVPASVRKGGMSVKFVQSSDNKYVQYMLMSDSFNTTVSNWQGVDDEPTDESENFSKSKGTYRRISNLAIKADLKGYIDNNGIFQSVPSEGWRSSDYIRVIEGMKIDYNAIGGSGANLVSFYNSNKQYVSGIAFSDSNRANGTETVPSSISYIRVCTDSYNNQMQHTFYIKDYYCILFDNIIKSQEPFDISVANAVNGTPTKYANIAAALMAVPSSYQNGGMSVKYIDSNSNKYLQYRLMSDTWTTTLANWQSMNVDEVPTDGSGNLPNSEGVYNKNNSLAIKADLKGYIDANGIFQSVPSGGFRSSDFIRVKEGMIVKYDSIGGADVTLIACYDENKQYVRRLTYSGSTRESGSYTIGNDVAYIRVCTDSYNNQMQYYFFIDDYFAVFLDEVISSQDYIVGLNNKGYIDTNGIFQSVSAGGWRSSDFVTVKESMHLRYSSIGGEGANAISFYDRNKNYIDGIVYLNTSRVYDSIEIPDGTRYVRVCTDSYSGQTNNSFIISDYYEGVSLVAECEVSSIKDVSEILVISLSDFINDGYLSQSGTINSNAEWKTTDKISVKDYNTLTLSCYIDVPAYGVFWDDANNVIKTFQTTKQQTLQIPCGAHYIQLTNNIVLNKNPFAYLKQNVHNETRYENIVRKPFSFNGKSAVFCGDSITKGFVTQSFITPNGFPKLFSDKVGMTFTNLGIGGSCFYGGDVQTIVSQVEDASKSVDFLFIAGGVNDWQLDHDYATFGTTIENLCTYINSNYPQSTQVIWITPINVGRTSYFKPTKDLQKFRNIITEKVIENDTYNRFTILQGDKFPFPDERGNIELRTALFGDMIHPSEAGYQWYCATLQTYLI